MTSISQIDLAWAAGFIDGEGCFQISGDLSSCDISAFQTSILPIAKLKDLFGGHTWFAKARGTSREGWIWEVSSQKAVTTDNLILPYLVVKDSQAQILIAFAKTILKNNGSRLTDEIREKRRGLRSLMTDINKGRPIEERIAI